MSRNVAKEREHDAKLDDLFLLIKTNDIDRVQAFLFDNQLTLNVNRVRWSGFSVMHKAAASGLTDVCFLLLENGAELNMRSTRGWYTPLHLACGNGYFETAMYLIKKGADSKALSKYKEDIYTYAIKRGFRSSTDDLRKAVFLHEMKIAASAHDNSRKSQSPTTERVAVVEGEQKKYR